MVSPVLGRRHLPAEALDYARLHSSSELNYWDGGVRVWGFFGGVCQHASVSPACGVAGAVLCAQDALLACRCCGIMLSEPSWPGMVVLAKPNQALCPSVRSSSSLSALEQGLTPLRPQAAEPCWLRHTVLTKFGSTLGCLFGRVWVYLHCIKFLAWL